MRPVLRTLAATAVLSLLTTLTYARPATALPPDPPAVQGQALVRFRPGAAPLARAAVHARAGARVVGGIARLGYELVAFDTPLDGALASYRADPAVALAEPNYRGRIALSPSDACHAEPCVGFNGQWHHELTNTPFGWDVFPGRTYTAAEKLAIAPLTIAVLDTKIDATHPDFANPGGTSDARAGGQLDLANTRDWVPPARHGGAAAYHGTFVAGLAAAATGNGRDAAGVGYAARILPLTVVDGNGNTDAASLADAIVYAWKRGAAIINLSLGILGDSAAVHDAIRLVTHTDAERAPSLVVAASGNNTGSSPFYPGSYPEVMSASGTDASDRRAACSNYNANVSVSAPADRLIGLAPMPGKRTQAPCGTSAAAPQVSGLGALLFMQDPSRTPADVRALIERGADDLGTPGRDDVFGHGRINIERALRADRSVTTGARASVVATGGASTITAAASDPSGVQRGELIFDRPDAVPVPMQAVDGSFGGSSETLRATFTVPAGTTAGPHPVWVRAHDGIRWGPASVTVLAIDVRAPVISGAAATNGLRATATPVRVTFTATDDYSATVGYGIEFRSTATNAIVATVFRLNLSSGAQRYDWLPGAGIAPGHYRVKIAVADGAGNTSSTEVGTLVT